MFVKINYFLIMLMTFAVLGQNAKCYSPEHITNLQSSFIKLDQYLVFDVYFNNESETTRKAHLNNFAREIKERTGEVGYIISYAGKTAKVDESKHNLMMIEKYLTEKKKIKTKCLVFIDGGFRNKAMTEFYFVPRDAPPPKPSPTFTLEEVIIVKD